MKAFLPLGTALVLLAGLSPASQRRSDSPTGVSVSSALPTEPSTEVTVRLRGDSGPFSFPLADVCGVLRPALLIGGEQNVADRVRAALAARYGPRMTEKPEAASYMWVWVIDHWVMVCLAVSAFEIPFGQQAVIVTVREQRLM